MATVALGVVLLAVLVAFFLGRRRLAAQTAGTGGSHSLPGYHGAFVALWAGLPACVLVLVWLLLQGPLIESLLVASLPAEIVEGTSAAQRNLLVAEIKSIAAGQVFGEPDPAMLAAAERFLAWRAIASWAMVACAAALALLGLSLARSKVSPAFRARQRVERILFWLMVFCSTVAVVTTLGILLSLLFEAFRFFERVPLTEFLFGLNWEPQMPIREDQVAGHGAFGAIPVFTGTLLVALLAMLVAGPVGLLSAIYLAEYAGGGLRKTVKPVLEILAGVPTIVYGIFAVLTVAPALRDAGAALGIAVAPNSALAAGAVMGIMIIPFISSLSDDAIAAVPQSMRDGAYALGATKAETIVSVLLPAALPGIVGGFLLAASRAIGETMIVVMAAGLIANLTADPLEAVTTVTVQIVTLLIGDTEFDSPKTLAAFALGLVLFLATLALNVVALRFVQKYREKYE